MLSVARQSFALTLYTAWHLTQLERVRMFTSDLDAYKIASLVAKGFHDPKGFDADRDNFLASQRQFTPSQQAQQRARVLALVAAHRRLIPIEAH